MIFLCCETDDRKGIGSMKPLSVISQKFSSEEMHKENRWAMAKQVTAAPGKRVLNMEVVELQKIADITCSN